MWFLIENDGKHYHLLCAKHCSKFLIPHIKTEVTVGYPHITDEHTEAQKNEVICVDL